MKIKIKKNPVKETLNRLAEISAKSIGLDPKRDTTISDDDLLNLISQSDIDKNPHYRYMLENGYIPINRPPPQYAPLKQKDSYDDYDDYDDLNDIRPDMSAKLGEGAYGVVYEATKVGTDKRYAVKITDDANEVVIRRKLEAAREKLPESIMAHFVRVQDIVELDKEQRIKSKQKPLYLIAMQLVRPMNKFESTALFQGVSALTRMTADFNSKYIIKDPKVFKEIFTNRVMKFDFSDDLMIHFTASRTAKGKKPTDDERRKFAEMARQFDQKFSDDLLKGLSDSLLGFWRETITNLLAGQNVDDLSSYGSLYGYAAVELATELCKEIAKKDGKRYGLLFKEMGLLEALERDGSLEDYLFDRILNLSSQFEFGMRTEWKDFIKNRYGKEQGEFKMKYTYGDFVNTLRAGEDKGKIREKFNEIAEKMPEKVKNFMGALMTLALDEGILWRDLHEGNVMIDPQTREYVAVDVGMFSTDSIAKQRF
jgi:serine/threonine protein kinase